MNIEEIFSLIAARMVEGLMIHSQMSDYFCFLGLEGYAKCHKYHYFEENCNYRKISYYYLTHYNQIITERPFSNPNIIPADWYKYKRQNVDMAVRKASIKAGFEKWVKWEKESKKVYETYYQELIKLNEIAAATELQKYIVDVDYELSDAEEKLLTLTAIDFDISDIIAEQDKLAKKYKKELKEIELC